MIVICTLAIVMILERLSLLNFKNYDETQLEFCPKFNCFVGDNGMGKTNVLDAIHYLSFCKSFFNSVDSQNIKHDLPFFVIQGWVNKTGNIEEIYCGVKRGHKKQFKHNKKEYERLSEHIGLYPLVMISPSDSELIWDGSEVRRKFIDSIISQYNKHYLEYLIAYTHVLQQRNALLKQFNERKQFDAISLEIWDEQLITYGNKIITTRLQFLEEFIPLFSKNYVFISGSKESVNLQYQSSLKEKNYKDSLEANIARDRVLQHTTVGPHRDDLDFTLEGNSLKKFASQGQQKSYLLALKLAQFEFIKDKKQTKPLLLLDDIYDKLDETRFNKLITLVSGEQFGQVFITDTHPKRIEEVFTIMHAEHIIYRVENGTINHHG